MFCWMLWGFFFWSALIDFRCLLDFVRKQRMNELGPPVSVCHLLHNIHAATQWRESKRHTRYSRTKRATLHRCRMPLKSDVVSFLRLPLNHKVDVTWNAKRRRGNRAGRSERHSLSSTAEIGRESATSDEGDVKCHGKLRTRVSAVHHVKRQEHLSLCRTCVYQCLKASSYPFTAKFLLGFLCLFLLCFCFCFFLFCS